MTYEAQPLGKPGVCGLCWGSGLIGERTGVALAHDRKDAFVLAEAYPEWSGDLIKCPSCGGTGVASRAF